jgi:hypothetical protein
LAFLPLILLAVGGEVKRVAREGELRCAVDR